MHEPSNEGLPSLLVKLGKTRKSCITLSFLWMFVKTNIKYFAFHI